MLGAIYSPVSGYKVNSVRLILSILKANWVENTIYKRAIFISNKSHLSKKKVFRVSITFAYEPI